MRIACAALLLCSCNSVFGIETTQLRDGSPDIDPTGDGGGTPDRPIIPPDGKWACGVAPDFESWQYTPRAIDVPNVVGQFGVYASGDDEHLVVTNTSAVFDVDVATSSGTEIASLQPPQGRMIGSLSVSPDGGALWFTVDDDPHVAFRATGFVRTLTDLGLPEAYEVLPASPGYYDGSLRMVVRVRETSASPQTYVELSSLEGVTWQRVVTLPFGGPGYLNANLSADGCTLLFTRMEGGSTYALYASSRSSDDSFGMPVRLDAASATTTTAFNPALAPSTARLWFATLSSATPLVEGHP